MFWRTRCAVCESIPPPSLCPCSTLPWCSSVHCTDKWRQAWFQDLSDHSPFVRHGTVVPRSSCAAWPAVPMAGPPQCNRDRSPLPITSRSASSLLKFWQAHAWFTSVHAHKPNDPCHSTLSTLSATSRYHQPIVSTCYACPMHIHSGSPCMAAVHCAPRPPLRCLEGRLSFAFHFQFVTFAGIGVGNKQIGYASNRKHGSSKVTILNKPRAHAGSWGLKAAGSLQQPLLPVLLPGGQACEQPRCLQRRPARQKHQ